MIYHSHSFRFLKSAICWILVVSLAFPPPLLMANPLDGTVVQGSASITSTGNTTTINQSTNRAIIHWNSFSINQGETTRFNLPASSSAVLNRVTGQQISTINGTLSSNGHVYLINPNGVIVGPSGAINTNSFVASTLNIPDNDFMDGGNLTFQGSSKQSLLNYGSITALEGDIYLIGASVENHGRLNAPHGTVGLAAGLNATIVDGGHPSLVVRATDRSLSNVGVLNTGTINALQAELIANGSNVFGLAINNTGTIRATGYEKKGGRVFLVADGGDIESSGTIVAKRGNNGGEVNINAGSDGTAKLAGNVDVSGDEGGSVKLRGSYIDISEAEFNLAEGGTVAALVGNNTIQIIPGQVPGNPDENVILQNGETTGTTVKGTTNQTDTVIVFTSNEGEVLKISAKGQAILEEENGNTFSGLMITPEDSALAFTEVEFNIITDFRGNNSSTVLVTVEGFDSDGNPISQTLEFDITQGENFVNLIADDGDVITKVTISNADDEGSHILQLRQVRVSVGQAPGPGPGPGPGPEAQARPFLFLYVPIYPRGTGQASAEFGDDEERPEGEVTGNSSFQMFGSEEGSIPLGNTGQDSGNNGQ